MFVIFHATDAYADTDTDGGAYTRTMTLAPEHTSEPAKHISFRYRVSMLCKKANNVKC